MFQEQSGTGAEPCPRPVSLAHGSAPGITIQRTGKVDLTYLKNV